MVEWKYKVRWTPRAAKGYQKIIAYLIEEWPLPVAENFIKTTEGKIATLSGQPFVGKATPGKSTRSILITKHNKLYYRVKKDFVELVGFYDTRQHPSKNKFEK